MDARLLDEAADWLVRLNDEGLTAAERIAFERWRQASPAHEGAWMRAERLMDKLGRVAAGAGHAGAGPIAAAQPTGRCGQAGGFAGRRAWWLDELACGTAAGVGR